MDRANRDRYLDLLIKVLTNVIYEDVSIFPATAGTYSKDARTNGLDWPAVAHTMVGIHRLQSLRSLVQRVIDERIPGHFIETGVWRGGSCILMRAVLAANGVTDRKVFVADSFQGLPPPKPDEYPLDSGSDMHTFPQLAVSLEQVRANFALYDLLDDQVVFVPGFFDETLPDLDASPFALIRLDGDLYESTHVALEALYPKLSPGGFAIIDDYGLPLPAARAVDDYRDRFGITAPLQWVDESGVWWQKPPARRRRGRLLRPTAQ